MLDGRWAMSARASAPITVTGEGGKVSAGTEPADRDVELTAVDYSFEFTDPKIKLGETILFEMKNSRIF